METEGKPGRAVLCDLKDAGGEPRPRESEKGVHAPELSEMAPGATLALAGEWEYPGDENNSLSVLLRTNSVPPIFLSALPGLFPSSSRWRETGAPSLCYLPDRRRKEVQRK